MAPITKTIHLEMKDTNVDRRSARADLSPAEMIFDLPNKV